MIEEMIGRISLPVAIFLAVGSIAWGWSSVERSADNKDVKIHIVDVCKEKSDVKECGKQFKDLVNDIN